VIGSANSSTCVAASAAPNHASASFEHEHVVSAAQVLTALFQEGRGKSFAVVESSLQHVHYGSDLCVFLLAAIWSRDLPLMEAFLLLVKTEIKKTDEFCGAASSPATAVDSAAAVQAGYVHDSEPSTGAACLHACVQLGFYEGTLALLNFGVPVDAINPFASPREAFETPVPHAHSALMTAAMSNVPCSDMLDVAGLLLAHGANATFLADDALVSRICSSLPSEASSSIKKSLAAIKRFMQNHTPVQGNFDPPFVHIAAVVATHDSITKTKGKGRKLAVCDCRSGLCQLSPVTDSCCPCMIRDAGHRVGVPPFWNHSDMSLSSIDTCIYRLSRQSNDNDCDVNASVLRAVDTICSASEPLVAMKTAWSVLGDDEYGSELLLRCRNQVSGQLALAAVVAMMQGAAQFIDGAMIGREVRSGIGRVWIKAVKYELQQQQRFVTILATLSWMLLQLEDDVFKQLTTGNLPAHVRGSHRRCVVYLFLHILVSLDTLFFVVLWSSRIGLCL
jgi:hypothetical protein